MGHIFAAVMGGLGHHGFERLQFYCKWHFLAPVHVISAILCQNRLGHCHSAFFSKNGETDRYMLQCVQSTNCPDQA